MLDLLNYSTILFLIYISIKDIKTLEIKNKSLICLAIINIIGVFTGSTALIDGIMGFIVGLVIMLILSFLTNGSIGGGDIKLIAVMGIVLGIENILVTIIITFVLSGFMSLILLLRNCFKEKKITEIALAPFITTAVIALLISN